MDTFLGRDVTFWTAVGAISTGLYTLLVTVTLWFLYGQVKVAARTFELDALRRLQELVDEFREDRRKLFATLPLPIVLNDSQFARTPPARRRLTKISEAEHRKTQLTAEQGAAVAGLTAEQLELAQRVIGKLNDIGQLVEDRLVNKRTFLGKYHVMVLQVCHMVEAVRRDKELKRGGNYGQRLLRMRRWAASYNDQSAKHREIDVLITCPQGNVTIYRSPEATFIRRLKWALNNALGRYE